MRGYEPGPGTAAEEESMAEPNFSRPRMEMERESPGPGSPYAPGPGVAPL